MKGNKHVIFLFSRENTKYYENDISLRNMQLNIPGRLLLIIYGFLILCNHIHDLIFHGQFPRNYLEPLPKAYM